MTGSGVPTWEEVARDHGRFLYTVAYRLTGNSDDAQDLVQEVLIRVRRGLGTYQPGNLEGWLSRITTNAFLDEVRKRSRRPTTAFGSPRPATAFGSRRPGEVLPEDIERVLPPAPAADVDAEMRALPDDVQQALLGLPADYRAAVVLCDVVGLPYEEIASTLDVPLGTVRSRIHRGRALLRRALT